MALTDRELMERRLEVLYVRDRRGRLLSVNEPGPEQPAAPLVHVGAGGGVVVCATRQDVPDPVREEIHELGHRCAEDRAPPPLDLVHGLRAALERFCSVGRLYAGPAYRFPDLLPSVKGTVLVDRACARVLRDGFAGLMEELEDAQPCVAALANGRAVAVCQTVRRAARMVEAGLQTLPAYRRQGYGARAVLDWARLVRAAGLAPLYSASWENSASCGLAAKLGFVQYGTDLSLWEQTNDPEAA